MKYHYICKDDNGGLFMTTEKCSNKEEAQQYVGGNEVLYPFYEKEYKMLYTSKLEESKRIGIMYIKIDESGEHHLAYTDDMLFPLEETLCSRSTKDAIVDAHHRGIFKEDVYSCVDVAETIHGIKFKLCEDCYSQLKNR